MKIPIIVKFLIILIIKSESNLCNIMSSTFSKSTWSHPDKLCLLLALFDVESSAIAEARTNSTNKLMQNVFQGSGVWNVALNTLSRIFFRVRLFFAHAFILRNISS